MLNPLPEEDTKVWKDEVIDTNDKFDGNLQFVPREVTFKYKDRGMIWHETEYGAKFGWYSSQFFYTQEECQKECDLLNQEADGIITDRMKAKQEYIKQWVKDIEGKLIRIG